MPDIDVFAGISELANASNPGQPVAGLPDREQYQYWLAEQTAVESEMETFNKGKSAQASGRRRLIKQWVSTGDLERLKKFTKCTS